MPTIEPCRSSLSGKRDPVPRVLFHGTGRWSEIRATGGLRPDAARIFCSETGGMASCGGVYLTDRVSHAAYIADRSARSSEIDGMGHRTVLAVEVDASSLEADEDVLKMLVHRALEGFELHQEARAGKDAFWKAFLARDGGRIVRGIIADLGPASGGSSQGISERGIAAVIDRLYGPWDDLNASEAAINALTALHRGIVHDRWFDERHFHDAPRNRRFETSPCLP